MTGQLLNPNLIILEVRSHQTVFSWCWLLRAAIFATKIKYYINYVFSTMLRTWEDVGIEVKRGVKSLTINLE